MTREFEIDDWEWPDSRRISVLGESTRKTVPELTEDNFNFLIRKYKKLSEEVSWLLSRFKRCGGA